jgi:uncharacterized protein YceK
MKKFFISVSQIKLILLLLAFAFVVLAQSGCAQIASKSVMANKATITISSASEEIQKKLAKNWGIRIVGLRTTMTGLMVDFRYKILDAKKAAPLLDLDKKSYLLVEKSQARLGVPNSVKIGSLRQTTHAKKVKEGRDYFILFGNPGGRYIKPGDLATLVIGDLKVEHLVLL